MSILLRLFLCSFVIPLRAAVHCHLPGTLPRGYDVSQCTPVGNAALAANQCIVRCDSAKWYIGQPVANCTGGNSTHPGIFQFSGCRRPFCPLQCGASTMLLEEPSAAQLSGLAFDRRNGVVYVADAGRHVVLSVNVRGVGASSAVLSSTTLWGSLGIAGDADGSALLARLRQPAGLEFDALHKRLYVADSANGKVRQFDLNSQTALTIGQGFNTPQALALDTAGSQLIVSEFLANGRILRLPLISNGAAQSAAALQPVTSTAIAWPVGLALFPALSRLYVAQGGGAKHILEVTLTGGQATTIIGGGSAARVPEPVQPLSVALDAPKALAISVRSERPTLFIADSASTGGRVLAAEIARSENSCEDMGWQAGMAQGNPSVCGHSWAKRGGAVENLCTPWAGTGAVTVLCCSGLVNFSRAELFCKSQGARLCSSYEMEMDETKEGYAQPTCKTGTSSYNDYYDEADIWTSTPCTSGRHGVGGYVTRPGAREWSLYFPPKCVPPNRTAAYTKCCADSKLVMPVIGATPPASLSVGGEALFQSLASGSPTAIAWDAARERLFVGAGHRLYLVSWATPVAVVAGLFYGGHNGEELPASHSVLNSPLGLVYDEATAALYIADSQNNQVRKADLASTYILTGFAGTGATGIIETGDGGPALQAKVYRPHYVEVDPTRGGLYVSTGHHRVRFVSFSGNGTIHSVVNALGNAGVIGDSQLAVNAEINNPRGISLSADLLFVADRDNHRVRLVYTQTGIIETAAGPIFLPSAVTVSSNPSFGLVIYALSTDPRVTSVSPPKDLMRIAPVGLAADFAGNIVLISSVHARGIVHMERHVMPRRVRPVLQLSPTVPNPRSLLLASNGTLFVTDHDLHKIFAMEVVCTNQTGCVAYHIRTVAGNGTQGDGEPMRSRWTTTTTTVYTTTTTTSTTITVLWCENYLLGPGGWDCNATCILRNATCDPSISNGFDFNLMQSTVSFAEGQTCVRDTRSWWGNFLPAFETDLGSRNYGKCLGTYAMPSTITCTGKQTVYGSLSTTLRRWCKCRRPSTCGVSQPTPAPTPAPTTTAQSGTTATSPFRMTCPDKYIELANRSAIQTVNAGLVQAQANIQGCAVLCEVRTSCAAIVYNGEAKLCYRYDVGYTFLSSSVGFHETICIRNVSRQINPDVSLAILASFPQAATQMLSKPGAMALDETRQLLYFCDSENDKIKVVILIPATIYTVAGRGRRFPHYYGDGGLARDATLWYPQGLALDTTQGHLYIADTNNHVIRRVVLGPDGLTGTIFRVAGDNIASLHGDGGPVLYARFKYPWGITFDTANSVIYVSDSENDRIRRVDFGADRVTSIMGKAAAVDSGDLGPGTSAQLDQPKAIVMTYFTNGSAHELILDEFPNQRVRQLRISDGIVDTVIATYALNFSAGQGLIGVVPRDYDAEVSFPYGVAATTGLLYTASYMYQRIRLTHLSSGLTTTFAGMSLVRGSSGDGGPATSARLDGPTDVALDMSNTNLAGNAVYIVEGDGGRVRRVEISNNTISTVMSVSFGERLYGIAVDSVNQILYVASPTLHQVRRVVLSGSGMMRSCTAPPHVSNAASPSCAEGAAVTSTTCTSACITGWVATEQTLSCHDGVLIPPDFSCEPGPCVAPSGLQHAFWPVACKEGRSIPSGQNCTVLCASGYVPDHNLSCFAGTFTPPSFQCCPAPACIFTTTSTTNTSTTTTIIVTFAPVHSTNSPNNSNVSSGGNFLIGGGPGGSATLIVVHGSVAFLSVTFSLNATEIGWLAVAGSTLRGPLQSALATVFGVMAQDVDVQAVQAVLVRRRRLGTPKFSARLCRRLFARRFGNWLEGRSLQSFVHQLTVVYTVSQAPNWGQATANALGSPSTATSIQFAQSLDQAGFASTLQQASVDRNMPCTYPTGITGAPMMPCSEGFGSAPSGSRCTAICFAPKVPSIKTLTCFAGIWSPAATFTCQSQASTVSNQQQICAPPAGIVGATTPPCVELQANPATNLAWCTPACETNRVPSEVGLACVSGNFSPPVFSCRLSHCTAPTSIAQAAPSPCQEGSQIPLSGHCTGACLPGYAANPTNLTCARGVLTPSTFACVNPGGGSTGNGNWWGHVTPSPAVAAPRRRSTTPAAGGSWRSPTQSSNGDDSSSGLGLIIIVVVLTVLMVTCVSAGIGALAITMQRRAREAKIADGWQNAVNAVDHINLSIDEDAGAAKANQERHDVLCEESNSLEKRPREGQLDGSEELLDGIVEPQVEEIGQVREADDPSPKKLKRGDSAKKSPRSLITVPAGSRTPRSYKVDKLDCPELLRLAQKAANGMKNDDDLSARTLDAQQSAQLDDLFDSVKNAAAGVAACDSLVLNDAQRAAAEREARFDALDDELAWSTQDDSHLLQLVTGTPATACGLRTEIADSVKEATKVETLQPVTPQPSSLASQLFVRPAPRTEREDTARTPRTDGDIDRTDPSTNLAQRQAAEDGRKTRRKSSQSKRRSPRN